MFVGLMMDDEDKRGKWRHGVPISDTKWFRDFVRHREKSRREAWK